MNPICAQISSDSIASSCGIEVHTALRCWACVANCSMQAAPQVHRCKPIGATPCA